MARSYGIYPIQIQAVEKDEVKIKGIPAGQVEQLAGSLKKYARSYVPLNQVREKIKGKIADETAREGLSD